MFQTNSRVSATRQTSLHMLEAPDLWSGRDRGHRHSRLSKYRKDKDEPRGSFQLETACTGLTHVLINDQKMQEWYTLLSVQSREACDAIVYSSIQWIDMENHLRLRLIKTFDESIWGMLYRDHRKIENSLHPTAHRGYAGEDGRFVTDMDSMGVRNGKVTERQFFNACRDALYQSDIGGNLGVGHLTAKRVEVVCRADGKMSEALLFIETQFLGRAERRKAVLELHEKMCILDEQLAGADVEVERANLARMSAVDPTNESRVDFSGLGLWTQDVTRTRRARQILQNEKCRLETLLEGAQSYGDTCDFSEYVNEGGVDCLVRILIDEPSALQTLEGKKEAKKGYAACMQLAATCKRFWDHSGGLSWHRVRVRFLESARLSLARSASGEQMKWPMRRKTEALPLIDMYDFPHVAATSTSSAVVRLGTCFTIKISAMSPERQERYDRGLAERQNAADLAQRATEESAELSARDPAESAARAQRAADSAEQERVRIVALGAAEQTRLTALRNSDPAAYAAEVQETREARIEQQRIDAELREIDRPRHMLLGPIEMKISLVTADDLDLVPFVLVRPAGLHHGARSTESARFSFDMDHQSMLKIVIDDPSIDRRTSVACMRNGARQLFRLAISPEDCRAHNSPHFRCTSSPFELRSRGIVDDRTAEQSAKRSQRVRANAKQQRIDVDAQEIAKFARIGAALRAAEKPADNTVRCHHVICVATSRPPPSTSTI